MMRNMELRLDTRIVMRDDPDDDDVIVIVYTMKSGEQITARIERHRLVTWAQRMLREAAFA